MTGSIGAGSGVYGSCSSEKHGFLAIVIIDLVRRQNYLSPRVLFLIKHFIRHRCFTQL